MNPLVATAILAGTTTIAKWRKGEQLSTNQIIAFFAVAVMLGLIDLVDKDLARAFSWLVVVAGVLANWTSVTSIVTGE